MFGDLYGKVGPRVRSISDYYVCSVNVSNVTRCQYQRWFLCLVTCVQK